MATMVELKPKRSHTLTVLRKQELASHPVPAPETSAAPQLVTCGGMHNR